MRNHFICQGYLKGFGGKEADENGKERWYIAERDPNGDVFKIKIDDVCFEEAESEPTVELIRKEIESWWGNNRNIDWRLVLQKGYESKKEKLAEFVAISIMLSEVGRRAVREHRQRHVLSDRQDFEAINLFITARDLKEQFLGMNWMIVKPAIKLLTSESPATWKMESGSDSRVRSMFFPLTTNWLLCVGKHESVRGVEEDIGDYDSSKPTSFASSCAISSNTELLRGVRDNGFKLYAPIGYDWTLAEALYEWGLEKGHII